MEKTTTPPREAGPLLIWQTPHFNVVLGVLAATKDDQPEFRKSYVVMDREHGVVAGVHRTRARAMLQAVEAEGDHIGIERMREEIEARGFQPMEPEPPPPKGKNGH